jgi:hypothetical protein
MTSHIVTSVAEWFLCVCEFNTVVIEPVYPSYFTHNLIPLSGVEGTKYVCVCVYTRRACAHIHTSPLHTLVLLIFKVTSLECATFLSVQEPGRKFQKELPSIYV